MTGEATDVLNVARQMAVSLSRLLRDRETVFHGVASPLPMVATQLARATHAPDLVYLSIAGGVDAHPESLPASTADAALRAGATSYVTLSEIFDLSARGRLDVGFLSGVQIDGSGRINMSAIGDFQHPKVRLPGGAGSALLMPTARRPILWRTRHDPRVFVEHLDFITASGSVDAVVTPLGVFRGHDGMLDLSLLHPGVTVQQVAESTGFPLRVSAGITVAAPPTSEELRVLERIDPLHVVASEF